MFQKIIINSPWYYFLICLLVGFVFAFILYFKNKKNVDVPKKINTALLILRFLSTALITFLLLNIFLKQTKNETQNPTILLAIDNSSSIIALTDSTFVKNDFLKKLEVFKKNIGENFNVKTILFGSKTELKNQPDFKEKETDIENLLNDLENNYSNQNIGALIISSDGIYSKGSNPIYGIEKLGYPVYTIAMGDTNEVKDVALQKINHNQVAYLGNNFPIEVFTSAKNFKGKEILVTVSHNAQKITQQTVKINSDNFISTTNFTINAGISGVQRYVVNTTILEGEKNSLNNSQSFIVEVIDNREKILLLANYPHPDVAAVKDAILNSTTYEIEYGISSEFKKPIKPYSLVIIHGSDNANQSLMNDCKNNSVPVWIINPSSTENLSGVKIGASLNKFNDADPTINKSFGLFNMSDEFKKFTKELPPLKTFFGNYNLSNSANSLINQKIGVVETENPILIFNESNSIKNAVLIGDGLWRWKLRDFAEHGNANLFNELISKSVQYLAVKSDKSFFRITAPKVCNENENIELGAEVYNKSYELITEPDVVLTLTNSDKKTFNYTFSKTSNAYKLNIGLLPSGEYKYEAKVKVNNELYVKQGIVVVKEIVSEKINTVANHQLLFQLANKTGGRLFYPKQLDKLQSEILNNQLIKPITYSETTTNPLIELKWLIFILIALLSTEWFVRKRYIVI
ncbi:MAG: hypothetical protein SFY56_08440 [Bacteroidota bacterium]|nr:hypothetical protein [Bacteroidota bacterium]